MNYMKNKDFRLYDIFDLKRLGEINSILIQFDCVFVKKDSDLFNGIQKVLIFSIDNLPFSFNELNILIEDGVLLSHDDLDVVVASKEGQQIPVVYNVVESKSFKIKNSYPNPFNPSTNLTYQVEKEGDLKVVVHNILGQQVAELYNGYQTYGSHSLTWDASNMSSGVYYITLELNGQFENSKVMLVK